MPISLQVIAKYESKQSDTSYELRVYNTVDTIAIGDRLQTQGRRHAVKAGSGIPRLNGDTRNLEDTVKGSSLEIGIWVDEREADIQKWSDFRTDLIESEEGKYICAFLKDGVFNWGGYLQTDNVRFTEQSPQYLFTLYAVDGLGALDGFPYGYYELDGGDYVQKSYTDKARLTQFVQRCLAHLPHKVLYDSLNGDAELFVTDVNYYAQGMPSTLSSDDPMYYTQADSFRFLKLNDKNKIVEVTNAKETLSEVCRFFGADIRQSNGRYEIVSFNRRTASNLRFKKYDATTETAVGTEQYPQQVSVGNNKDVKQLANPTRYLLPPARQIKVYHKKSDYYANSLIVDEDGTSGFTFGTEQSLGFITANGSNTIRVQIGFDLNVSLLQDNATDDTVPGVIRLLAKIQCGTKYLANGSSSFDYEWTSTEGAVILQFIGTPSNPWGTSPATLGGFLIGEVFYFDYDSGNYFPPFPEDGEVKITVTFAMGKMATDGSLTTFATSAGNITYTNASTEGNTTGLNGLLGGGLWYIANNLNLLVNNVESDGSDLNGDTMYLIDNEKSTGEITDNSKIIELQDAYLMGGQNVDNSRVVKIWNGSAWVFSQLWQYNGLGSTYTYDKLLLYDWLRFQSEAVERYQMTLVMNSADVEFGKTLAVGAEIFVMIEGKIDTSSDRVTGHWVKVSEKTPPIRTDVVQPPIKPIIKGDIRKLERMSERLDSLMLAKYNIESIRRTKYIPASTLTSLRVTVNWTRAGALKDGNTIRVIRITDLTYEDFIVSADTTSGNDAISIDSKAITEDIPEGSYIIFEPEYFATSFNSKT